MIKTKEPVLVIMAAGMGSRFGGLKQITPVDEIGSSIIDFSMYDAWRAGFRKVVFIIKHAIEEDFKAAVGRRMEAYFDVRYVFQELGRLPEGFSVPEGRTKPWGTAHAIACAAEAIDGPFAVLNADDYYGAGAMQTIYDFLSADHAPNEHAMVGYRLRNTVTENGYVSRGVCEMKDGYLQKVTEVLHIEKRGDDAAYTEDDEHYTPLSGDTLVSMNLWGFQYELLEQFVGRFPAFLRENLPKNPTKCEYFLPLVANAQLQEGLGTIQVLPTQDVWHGITYSEDMAAVKQAIRDMKDAGLYPECLWQKPAGAYHFKLEGAPYSIEPYGNGHIHETFLLTSTTGRRYILQRVKDSFDAAALAENIRAVTDWISERVSDPRCCRRPVPADDGGLLYTDETGTYRVYVYTENGVCLQKPLTAEQVSACAAAYGNFLRQMEDFPADTLKTVFPGYHNTPEQYKSFREALQADTLGRAASVQPEVDFLLAREEAAGRLQSLRDAGKLPVRVTHGDTKFDNVLFDGETGKPLCVVDLDTVMSGLSVYDFGDCVRSCASVDGKLDLDLVRACARGYLSACTLTEAEIENLALAVETVEAELAARYLTDYLCGEQYFRTAYDGQNLDRARAVIALVRDTEEKRQELSRIIGEEAAAGKDGSER